jgi:hypothetical protein
MTVFSAGGHARTMDFHEGDVGYVEKSMPHYIEKTLAIRICSSLKCSPRLPGHLACGVAGAYSFSTRGSTYWDR